MKKITISMGNTQKAFYKSTTIDSIIKESMVDGSLESTKNKMLLSIRIREQMLKLGINNTELANRLGKKKSVITKWLSGTCNFTIDTISEIEKALNFKLLKTENESELVRPIYKVTINVHHGQKATAMSIGPSQEIINCLPVKQGEC